jgi:hypothetical protein
MTRDQAETLAAVALAWLASDKDALGRFMALAGLSAGELRGRAADPEFLGFVLDFVLEDDASVLATAETAGVAPDRIAVARSLLPGGDAPHWT